MPGSLAGRGDVGSRILRCWPGLITNYLMSAPRTQILVALSYLRSELDSSQGHRNRALACGTKHCCEQTVQGEGGERQNRPPCGE